MPLIQKVAKSYKKFSNDKKYTFYQNIHDKMSATGSPFPTPTIAYTVGQTQIDALKKALGDALTKARGTAAALRDKVKIVEVTIDDWAKYVDSVAKGSESIITSAGYEATSADKNKTHNPDQPLLKEYTKDGTDSITFTMELLEKNLTYTFIISTNLEALVKMGNLFKLSGFAADDVVFFSSSKQRKVTFTGLPTKTDLYMVCIVNNAAGMSTASDVLKFGV